MHLPRKRTFTADVAILILISTALLGCGKYQTAQQPAPPSNSSITISNVTTTNLSATGVTINWTTSGAGTSQVDYGTSVNYGGATEFNSALVTSHSVSLTGLSASTLYYFLVKSKDANGVEVDSGSSTFNTPSSSPKPPAQAAVTLSPSSINLQVNGTQQFTATVTGTTNTAVTWTATGGTVGSTGLYTAPSSAGSFAVTATSVVDVTAEASSTITVTQTPPTEPTNGWTSRITGVNVPGGAASIVSSQDFDATLVQPCTAPCNSYAPGKQIYAQYYNNGTPATDCTVSADGPCSLKFTVTNGSFQGDAGWYEYNFSANLATTFGEGQEFFVQYKIRLDPGILGNFSGAGGLKHDITTEGDTPTNSAPDCSNSPGEIVSLQDLAFNGPWMYVNCGFSGGNTFFVNSGYEPLQLGGAPGTNFLDQDAAGCPHYAGQGGIPVTDPTCFLYKGNEWFTIQKHIKVGNWGQPNSVIEQWVAHAGQTSILTNQAADAAIPNDGTGGASGKYGKIQLSTYDTGATFNVNTAAWFDDLIVSTRRIPDPDTAIPNAPDSLSLSNISAGSVTINWRVNSQNGSPQDDTGFLVERCAETGPNCLPNPQSGFSQIAVTAAGATSYVDNTVIAGATYTYRVRARNAAGNSAYAVAQCFNGGPTCGGTAVIP
jgi:hypothetical protein